MYAHRHTHMNVHTQGLTQEDTGPSFCENSQEKLYFSGVGGTSDALERDLISIS